MKDVKCEEKCWNFQEAENQHHSNSKIFTFIRILHLHIRTLAAFRCITSKQCRHSISFATISFWLSYWLAMCIAINKYTRCINFQIDLTTEETIVQYIELQDNLIAKVVYVQCIQLTHINLSRTSLDHWCVCFCFAYRQILRKTALQRYQRLWSQWYTLKSTL